MNIIIRDTGSYPFLQGSPAVVCDLALLLVISRALLSLVILELNVELFLSPDLVGDILRVIFIFNLKF